MTRIDFGAEGNAEPLLAGGWARPEKKFRWMTGLQSGLTLARDPAAGEEADHILDLEARPFLAPPAITGQRLVVSVNDRVVGETRLTNESRFGVRIPAAALEGRPQVSLVFSHPDAARPCDLRPSNDQRRLSVALARLRVCRVRPGATGGIIRGSGGISAAELPRRVGMDAARLILNFESLGNNCEFGLVQRRCGAEPFFSLLRFAGMELPTLLRALDLGMEDFADPANVEIRVDDKPRPEFVFHENRYGVWFHTFRYQDETRAEQLLASETKRLAYCARRLLADFKRGHKILVFKRNETLREEEMLPLAASLSAFGDSHLLWMVPADAEHAPGTVETVLPRLHKGYISRFAPYEDAPDLKFEEWLEVCANAWTLQQSKLTVALT